MFVGKFNSIELNEHEKQHSQKKKYNKNTEIYVKNALAVLKLLNFQQYAQCIEHIEFENAIYTHTIGNVYVRSV